MLGVSVCESTFLPKKFKCPEELKKKSICVARALLCVMCRGETKLRKLIVFSCLKSCGPTRLF
jgi:hypothetical protein